MEHKLCMLPYGKRSMIIDQRSKSNICLLLLDLQNRLLARFYRFDQYLQIIGNFLWRSFIRSFQCSETEATERGLQKYIGARSGFSTPLRSAHSLTCSVLVLVTSRRFGECSKVSSCRFEGWRTLQRSLHHYSIRLVSNRLLRTTDGPTWKHIQKSK